MPTPCLFLDIDFPPVAWAAGRGVLVPAFAGKTEPGFISFMLATLIRKGRTSRIINEQIIESIRQTRHPTKVSRMTGLFYFEEQENAERAAKEWNIFKLQNLTGIDLQEKSRPTSRYDSNWYTDAPREESGIFNMRDIAWVDRYLSGEAMPTKKPLWENITESRVTIIDDDIKQRAVEVIRKQFPESLTFFEIARAGAKNNFDIGNSTPFLAKDASGHHLNWMLDMREVESPEFLRRLQEPGMIADIRDVMPFSPPGTLGRVPDFRPYSWSGELIPGSN